MSKRHLFLFLAGAMLWSMATLPPALAQSSASSFIQQTGQALIAELETAKSQQARRQALADIINRTVDVDEVAKFSLGRFWRQASPEQQKQYVDAFRRSLIATITARIGDFTGVKFTVGRSTPNGAETQVQSTIVRDGDPPLQVQWLVSSVNGHFKIIDLIAEGTSMRLTERSDYTSYLQQHGNNVQALIDALRAQAEQSS
jgi:phospholipid transport system substrate-binding protein